MDVQRTNRTAAEELAEPRRIRLEAREQAKANQPQLKKGKGKGPQKATAVVLGDADHGAGDDDDFGNFLLTRLVIRTYNASTCRGGTSACFRWASWAAQCGR